ncbi:hypothetical protein G210_1117 [Candida maltosa Xu316]|uniref:Uncharacterized protein n=1 Tax=Candida maltosa (strain Xu316) TaxID=1245528 RepID=M3IPF3_CANMX|nr:hypothetical protein G210_1117 [Candida maltosa Xu316]
MSARNFSTSAFSLFQKAAIKKSIPTPTTTTRVVINKWTPSHGNSFRSFAEYRLKVTNQSPLAKAAKNHNKVHNA